MSALITVLTFCFIEYFLYSTFLLYLNTKRAWYSSTHSPKPNCFVSIIHTMIIREQFEVYYLAQGAEILVHFYQLLDPAVHTQMAQDCKTWQILAELLNFN